MTFEKFLFLTLVITSFESVEAQSGPIGNLTSKCDQRHGKLDFIPSMRPGYSSSIKFSLHRDVRNLHLKFLVTMLGSGLTILDCSVNLCSTINRRSNIFTKYYLEYLLSSLKDFENIKCPLKKGFYEFGERKLKNFENNIKKYLPSFIKLGAEVKFHVVIFFVDKSQKYEICEINEAWEIRVL